MLKYTLNIHSSRTTGLHLKKHKPLLHDGPLQYVDRDRVKELATRTIVTLLRSAFHDKLLSNSSLKLFALEIFSSLTVAKEKAHEGENLDQVIGK